MNFAEKFGVWMNTLTEDQCKKFAELGYLVIDFEFSKLLLDEVITHVSYLYRKDPCSEIGAPRRVQDAWKTVNAVRKLAVSSVVLSALKQLFDREPLPFQTLNFPVGTCQRSHSDTVHFNSIPSGFMVGVWVALEDIDEANGPLQYYPGSHKLPEYSMQDFNLEVGYSNYHKYEECIDNLIKEEKLVAEFGLVKRGEAIIWHPNLLHGGAEQSDPMRTRHSQVTHYFFSDCQYITPMEGSKERPSYREPLWIPKTLEELQSLSETSVLKKIRRIARKVF